MTDDTRNTVTTKHQNRSRVDKKGIIPGIFNDDENEMKSLISLPDYLIKLLPFMLIENRITFGYHLIV